MVTKELLLKQQMR